MRRLRKQRDLVQNELADAIGVTLRTISNYESGRTRPKSKKILEDLAKVLTVDVSYFLDEKDPVIFSNELEKDQPKMERVELLIKDAENLLMDKLLFEEDKDKIMRSIFNSYMNGKSYKKDDNSENFNPDSRNESDNQIDR